MSAVQKRFSIAKKTALVCATFTLPIAVLLFLVVTNINEFIHFAQWENHGNAYQRPLEALLQHVQEQHIAMQSAGPDRDDRLRAAGTDISQAIDALQQVDARLGRDLQFTTDGLGKRGRANCRVEDVRTQWRELMSMLPQATVEGPLPQELRDRYAGLAATIRTMITHAGDTSNLILDPDLDSYYLMDVTLLALPQTQDRIAQIVNFGREILSRGELTREEQTRLAVQAALLQEADLDRIVASAQTSLNEDPNFYGSSATLQTRLPAAVAAYKAATSDFISLIRQAADPTAQPVDAQALEAAGLQARAESFRLWNVGVDELDALLAARIASYTSRRTMSLGLAGLALVVAAGLAYLATLTITRPLSKLVRSLGPGATLLAASVERIAAASQHGNTTPEESGIICEELNAHADDMRSAVRELELLVQGRADATTLSA